MNVIITGASRGIGFELAKIFCDHGYKVLAIARTKDKLDELENYGSINSGSGQIIGVECDLSKDLSSLNKVLEQMAGVNVLINNAGTLLNKPFSEISPTELEKVYQVNVFAPFRLIQKLIPNLAKGAHIINIGSVGGVHGSQKFPGLSAYSSSKGALSILTECLQAEFADFDYAFNCLALGAVQTEMLDEAFPGYKAEVTASEMAKYIYGFSFNSGAIVRGKTVMVSRSNP